MGSPISYSSIAQDVAISPNTVKKYLQILEALYIIFRVTPYSRNIARSLLKEPKIYFFDSGLVKGDEGIKFENMVATCLLKALHAQIDTEAKDVSLHYLRTKEQHEVDFAIVEKDQVIEILEVKWANHTLGKGLCYFSNKYNIPGVQVVKNLKRERKQQGIVLRDGMAFLQALNL
ncbi:MAG: hypothetical protein K940chlam9_01087 [Chlamydiae bacterium]|nr:hypothetical protein [Chlamydiota bacterium]